MASCTISKYIKRGAAVAAAGVMLLTLPSCEHLYEDLDPCPHGLRLRFVYDYNMEFANAFPAQVDCLTVEFYNADNGSYVTTATNVSADDLSDENWRMTIDLDPGEYTILAYGGLECSDASFHFVTDPAVTSLTDVEVALNPDCLTAPVGTNLHPLFYGTLTAGVAEEDTDYRDVTVYMMKDTNNLRVVLQQIDGDPLDNEDFDFKVTDDNTLFAYNNDVLPTSTVEYLPWTRGNASPGELPDGGESTVAFAEMSFPRLVTSNAPRLIITRRSDGYRVIDIPLNNYLLLLKSAQFASMGSQEFLDRESRWNMIFFLDRNHVWLKTQIIINDWVVRLNDAEV